MNLNQLLSAPTFSSNINLMLGMSLISLIPFFLMSTTSFLRIVIVFGMLRSAIGTQQIPPGPVIISMALFMTIFIMQPVYQQIYSDAIVPYTQGQISQQKAFETGSIPLKRFMIAQTREKDLALFVEFSKHKVPKNIMDLPLYVIIPAYMISELKTAFQIGFVIFIPFLVVDMIVSNVLLSLGMFMLSPVMVSLPFKILLFVLTDGWFVITRGLMQSFNVG